MSDKSNFWSRPETTFNVTNPWIVAIIGGAIGAVLAGIILYYSIEYRKGKNLKNIRMNLINNADVLLERNMPEDALKIYTDLLSLVYEKKDTEVYGHIKNKEGICYYNLSTLNNKEDNLIKAIIAFEKALKIYAVDKYPDKYATTKNNLGDAYSSLSEVCDKGDNCYEAIRAYDRLLPFHR